MVIFKTYNFKYTLLLLASILKIAGMYEDFLLPLKYRLIAKCSITHSPGVGLNLSYGEICYFCSLAFEAPFVKLFLGMVCQ